MRLNFSFLVPPCVYISLGADVPASA
jgi:hypothetical protein